MVKKNVAILFGGNSSEHEVSRNSAFAIASNISKEKYNLFFIGITKKGKWILYFGPIEDIKTEKWETNENNKSAFISPDSSTGGIIVLDNNEYKVLPIDVIIPVLHGKNGEDGSMQGLLQLSNIPFVGCHTLAAASCMDKITTNIILENAKINQAKFAWVTSHDFNKDPEGCIKYIEETINMYPLFVKPSNAGSSVGVSKASNKKELENAIEIAIKEDDRILIEEGIDGQEVECAVLGNDEPISSVVGEIAPSNEFYDYNAKYINDSKLYIPAKIDDKISDEIRKVAVKAYKAMGCSGLARVDFFVQKNTGKVLLNELNTFPGFTPISMYPKLMNEIGISFSNLIDNLIELAIERND